jgi:hypothetical protein
MPCTSTKTASARLFVRLHEDKLDPNKRLRLENEADVGFESSGSKLARVTIVVEGSVSMAQNCSTGDMLRSVGTIYVKGRSKRVRVVKVRVSKLLTGMGFAFVLIFNDVSTRKSKVRVKFLSRSAFSNSRPIPGLVGT